MLDIIRSQSSSLGVKVAFGVIILVFVFWGIGSFTDRGGLNVVASVNDEPITYQQFETAYRSAEESINRQQPGRSWTQAEKTQLGRQVCQRLVSELLVNQEARRIGLGVSPYELRARVSEIKAFQDEQGRFDPERYKNILAGQRKTPAAFEAEMTKEILQNKMIAFVAGGLWTDDVEARNYFNFLRQKRVVEYVFAPASSADLGDWAPTEEEIQKFYDESRADYAVPQKADVQYVRVDPLTLVDPASVTDDEARAWYEKNVDRFREPESVEVSHILVPLAPDASPEEVAKAEARIAEIAKELETRPFAEVADEVNPANAADKGGRVGWIKPGQTVPAFEQAAYAAEKDKVEGPVRSEFGLHLVLVTDRKPETTRSFDEVKDEVKTAMAQERGKERLAETLDVLTEENILGRPLAEAAAAQGLEAEDSGLCTAEELQAKLGVKPEGAQSILAQGEGQPVDIPLEAGQSFVVVRVAKAEPATFRELAEVRDDVISKLRARRGLETVRTGLEAALAQASAGDGDLPAPWMDGAKLSDPVDRGTPLAPFAAQPDLDRTLFVAAPGEWLPAVYDVTGPDGEGALVARIRQIMDPGEDEWAQFEQVIMQIRGRERADGVFSAFMESLAAKSKILVRNQDIVDRKNM